MTQPKSTANQYLSASKQTKKPACTKQVPNSVPDTSEHSDFSDFYDAPQPTLTSIQEQQHATRKDDDGFMA